MSTAHEPQVRHDHYTFQELINKYTIQLRHGCQVAQCSYPHCWTCRRRLATSPPRQPTLLTARMQAYALATRRDPYAALCPHEPVQETHDGPGASVAKRDASSLVQCLLNTDSVTSFEQHGTVSPRSCRSHATEEVNGDRSTEIRDEMHRQAVAGCMQALKPLFFTPTTLSITPSASSVQLTEAEKCRELCTAVAVVFYSDRLRSTSSGEANEMDMLLADRLVRAIAAQRCHWEIANLTSKPAKPYRMVECLTRRLLPPTYGSEGITNNKCASSETSTDCDGAKLLRILQTLATNLAHVLRHYWTGASVVRRWDTVGAALEILQDLDRVWQHGWDCPLSQRDAFKKTILKETRHTIRNPCAQELATSFSTYKESPNTRHLLQFPQIFDDVALVRHVRTMNYAAMLGSYRQSHFYDLFINIGPRKVISDRGSQYLDEKLKAARTRYLTLDVNRNSVIEDSFNQLRGREKRELTRPLKVIIGRSEGGGEIGMDQGGLTQEFFALAAAEIFNEDFGMFVTDEQSRYSWFRPLSPVPLYKFELLGVLFSLALYNGAIVPVNLPLALYRLLLGESLTDPVGSLKDGWPDLAQSFQYIMDWKEQGPNGELLDISEVLMREYTFSIETPILPEPLPEGWTVSEQPTPRGYVLEYDLHESKAQPQAVNGTSTETADQTPNDAEPSDEALSPSLPGTQGLVTNANRQQFVRDYIHCLLVSSVRPQYEAFARGFKTMLTPKTFSLLTPPLLQRLIEGDHVLNMDELERVTTYDNGYFPTHPVIRQFWATVRSWTGEKQRKLLEFVTASDRVPVTGLGTVAFSIVRNGAVEDLPTSQTCFGKFNLPEYESKEKLARMLDIALEYGQGFGVM